MPERKFVIAPAADITVKTVFDEFEKIVKGRTTYRIGGISTPFDSTSQKLIGLLGSSRLLDSAHLSLDNYNIFYRNNRIVDGSSETYHPSLSVIGFNSPDQNSNTDLSITILKTIDNFIREKGLEVRINEDMEQPNPERLASQLNSAFTAQVDRTNEYFRQLSSEWDQRRRQLDADASERLTALNAEKQAFEDQMRAEREELAAQRKELDDKSNMHARREIRRELITTLQGRQKSFQISRETTSLRGPIHAAFVILSTAAFAGAAWSLYVWGVSTTENWGPATVTSAIKTVLFTFAFLTTTGLYISWMNRWFDKHAEAQFQTRQFELDINRASWAVEAALEWRAASQEQMPDSLIGGITKHLFENGPHESIDYSPMTALAENLLGSAANIKMRVGKNEVVMDRKSIKDVKKAAAD